MTSLPRLCNEKGILIIGVDSKEQLCKLLPLGIFTQEYNKVHTGSVKL